MPVLGVLAMLLAIIVGAMIIIKARSNSIDLNDKYIRFIARVLSPVCDFKGGILKPAPFFSMLNGGENLCRESKEIEYTDYLKNCSLLVEK